MNFQYLVETYVEEREDIQFTCMFLGNMYDTEFSEDVLNLITNNLLGHPDIVSAELIEVESI